jgi:hypothetical protein
MVFLHIGRKVVIHKGLSIKNIEQMCTKNIKCRVNGIQRAGSNIWVVDYCVLAIAFMQGESPSL